ncbi:hypothetical protein QBC37DRAFT_378732 [Rhypophila decipiens]|uniref:Uncharacterized protein n=1 Tax=Rhypophila decipiens TaxID=261697 RepID=A0AAN6XY19_9PEZI|nr:hypothetical protein QBC37DRAFT_378732 [Rhypophila decipiens]
MSSSLFAGPGNDATLANRGEETTKASIMLGQQQDEQNQQQQPSAAEGSGGALGGGSSGIRIYIHSPTTTTSSGGSSGSRENQIQQYNKPKMFRKLSNSSSIISEIFKHPTDESAEERLRDKIRKANERDNENNHSCNNESRDLVEFLTTTAPPLPPTTTRQSRMSFSSLIPRGVVGFSSALTSAPIKAKGKSNRASLWAACKKWKAKIRDQSRNQKENRKENGHEPAGESAASEPNSFLLLPDSAVSGRTSGGHRHIAISIPIEEEQRGDERPSTGRTRARQSMNPSIRMDQVPRRVSSLAARRPKTASNLPEDAKPLLGGNQSHQDGLRPPSSQLEHARPRTADPLSGQRNTLDSFGSSDDSVSGQYPIRNHSYEYSSSIDIHESPEGLSVRGRHHWSLPAETSQPRQHEQGSQLDTSMVRNGNNSEAMLTSTPALHEYSPETSQKSHPPVVSRLRRVQSVLSFQGMGIALTTSDLTEERSMGQLSYREIINHHSSSPNHSSVSEDGQGQKLSTRSKSRGRPHNLRSLTINLPPPYRHGQDFVAPASAVGVVTKPLSNDSLRRLEEQSKVREPEPLRFSSIMTVADVKPSSSIESLQPENKTDDAFRAKEAPLTERPPLSAVFVPPQQYHHRPSIDEVLFPSPGWTPPYPDDDVSPSRNDTSTDATGEHRPAQTNLTTGTHAPREDNEHKIPRSPSHQALVYKYEALRETRDKELGLLVDRLEQLEHKNEWWLNSVVPMVDSMAKRLTRVYDDQSLPRLARERARIMRRDTGNSGGDVSNSESFDSFLPPIALPSPLQMPTTTEAQDQNLQPRGRKTFSDHQCQRLSLSHLEPESSLESFDSFSFNRHRSMPQQHRRVHSHPFTSIPRPPPTPLSAPPYPDSYMYTEESPEELGGDPGRAHRRSRLGSTDTIGSIYSNDSVPRINSQQDQEPDSPTATSSEAGHTYDFAFGHSMGLAVDRLPSRHGEKSLLNTIALPGGGASRSNSGHNSHSSTSPYSQHRASYSSDRTIDSIIAAGSGSAADDIIPMLQQSRLRSSRPRPHSLFIPRQTSQENDEEEKDNNSLEEENIFEEGRRPRPDHQRRVGIQDDRLNIRNNESNHIRWVPSFSTVTTSSSSGDGRPRVRPISWPSSSYGPPAQTQTPTQTHGRSHNRPSASTPAAIPVPVSMPQEAEQQEEKEEEGRNPTNTRMGQQQQQDQQIQQTTTTETETEWDTLEPLMRGLMETSRLDLELGRDFLDS